MTQEHYDFPAAITDEEMREAGTLRTYGIHFRTALALLSKSSEELTKIIYDDALSESEGGQSITQPMVDMLKEGEATARAHVELFESAQARITAAMLNAAARAEAEDVGKEGPTQ